MSLTAAKISDFIISSGIGPNSFVPFINFGDHSNYITGLSSIKLLFGIDDIDADIAAIQFVNTVVQSNSAHWNTAYVMATILAGLSANYNSVYSNVNSNSANWNYQGTDIKSLTSNWDRTFTNFAIQSANNLSVYSNVNSNSANWNYQGLDVKPLTANWQQTFTNFASQSANNLSVYSDVNSLSGNWNYQGNDVRALTGNWQSNYSTTNTLSANWNSVYSGYNSNSANSQSVYSTTNTLSANWNSAYSNYNSNSANFQSVYSTVNANSAVNWNYQGTDVRAISANWQSNYTSYNSNSASFVSTSNTVQSNSGLWGTGGTFDGTVVISNSAHWNSTYTTVNTNSATWGTGGGGVSSQWNNIPGGISYSAGMVGIGTSALSEALTVKGRANIEGYTDINIDGGGGIYGWRVGVDSGASFYINKFTGTNVLSFAWNTSDITIGGLQINATRIAVGPSQGVLFKYAEAGVARFEQFSTNGVALEIPNINSTTTPASGSIRLYTKTDGTSHISNLFAKQDDGTEILLTGGSSGSTVVTRNNSIYFPASEFIPRVTDGPGINSSELSGNFVNFDSLDFDAGTPQFAQLQFLWPKAWTSIKAKFIWTADTGSGDVVWGVAAKVYSDNQNLDSAPGTAQTITDTLNNTDYYNETAITSIIVPSGTIGDDKTTLLEISRVADDSGDTFSGNARLIAVVLFKGNETSEATQSTNIWIPAAAMIPQVTNGSGINSFETATYLNNADVLEFDSGTAQYADFEYIMPNNWDGGVITTKFIWTTDDTDSGDVVWSIAAVAFDDGEAFDTNTGGAQVAVDTFITQGAVQTSGATADIVIAGSPTNGKPIFFRVSRVAADGADTLGIPAQLKGIEVTYQASITSTGESIWDNLTGTAPDLLFGRIPQNLVFTASGDTTFTADGYIQGAIIKLYLIGDVSDRTLAFPAAWKWLEGTPASLTTGKVMQIDLVCTGSTEGSVFASYGEEQ